MRLLQDAVAAQAEARPEATAVVSHGTRLSYGELDRAANRLAQVLTDSHCRRGDRVALFMSKQPAAVVGMLGALKAGAAYVVLDPTEPPARLARTLRSAECRWLLGAGAVAGQLRGAVEAAQLERPPLIGWLDDADVPEPAPRVLFKRRDLDAFPDWPPSVSSAAEDLAQILFTSGSTGTPKGVMIAHASILRFIRWALRYFDVDETDRLSQHAPMRFDLSTFDIFGAFAAGAELHLVPAPLNLLPHKLAEFIRESRLTQWLSVPTALNLLAKYDAVRPGDFPDLRRVLFAGEVLPTPTLIYWMERLPHVAFTNLYGPTETTIASSYYTVPARPRDAREPIPIGRSCDGEELLVLDQQMQPVPVNEMGDLYIRGAGLTYGYWRDEEKTERAFLEDPDRPGTGARIYKTGDLARRAPDGLFHFCGRADMQIKTRGYRIELGEIETALNAVPELQEAAVVAVESSGFEGALICCAYAPLAGSELSPVELRKRLAQQLPNYMLPARWIRHDTLPKNVNGKIDRARLKEAFRSEKWRVPVEGPTGPADQRADLR